MDEKWNNRFLDIAERVSLWSKDPTRHVGAIIVGPDHKEIRATGYNGLPRYVSDNIDRFNKPDKYLWVEHAERNAIYNCARVGVSTNKCIMFTTLYPCADCARAIINSGIYRVVIGDDSIKDSKQWEKSYEISVTMFKEADVDIIVSSNINQTDSE